MNNALPIFLSFLAGISTVLGGLIIVFKKEYNSQNLSVFLGFSAGIMIGISLFDLLYNSYIYLSNKTNNIILIFIFVILGILIAILIDKLVPKGSNEIGRVGVISLIGIIIHNIPEGIATFITASYDIKLGISFALAIAIHNIPEGIAISIPLFNKTRNIKSTLLFTSIAGFSELLGAIISCIFLSNYINTTTMGILFAIIAGIMLHISFFELLPLSLSNDKKRGIYSLIIGILFILINIYI